MKVDGSRNPKNELKIDVCLIGNSVRETFFPSDSPPDRKDRDRWQAFRVIGVLEKKEQFLGGGGGRSDQSNVIYVPFESASRMKPGSADVNIMAIAKEGRLSQAQDQVEDLLHAFVARFLTVSQTTSLWQQPTASSISFNRSRPERSLAMVVVSSIGLMIGGIGDE
ncbi:MAG: ABC transporter permease, partial [Chloracidobacterium sp.]|nr:ABC transporter permease [Chloracidobacterium sp.]